MNNKINGILHIGAHKCEELDDYLKYISKDKIIFIEANKKLYDDIKKKDKDIIIFNELVSDTSGINMKFNIANNGHSSSIFNFGTHSKYYPKIKYIDTVIMKTKTIYDIYNLNNISPNFANFINLDIQGAELLALKGMGDLLFNIDYIYLEVNKEQLYIDIPLLPEIDDYLSRYNFIRVKTNITKYKWGDAFYIKNKNINKLVFINVYFGSLPNWMPLFIKTCEYNKDIDFYIFTNDITYKSINNIKFIYMTIDSFNELISYKLDMDIHIKDPYKLCDVKPMYGFIFEKYIKNYKYWGHCDLDMFWGDISKYINKYIDIYDVITFDDKNMCGPCTIYKNNDDINHLFKKNEYLSKLFDSDEYLKNDENTMFDIIKKYNINCKFHNIYLYQVKIRKFIKYYFTFNKGKIYDLQDHEKMFCHFSCRKKFDIKNTIIDSFILKPIIDYNNETIIKDIILPIKNDTNIICISRGGLCNKLKCLLSAMRFTNLGNISQTWTNFNELYTNNISIITKKKEHYIQTWKLIVLHHDIKYDNDINTYTSNNIDNTSRANSKEFCESSFDTFISDKSIDFKYDNIPINIQNLYIDLLKCLEIKKELLDIIKLISKQFNKNTISVHIRSWISDKWNDNSKKLHNQYFDINKIIRYMNQYNIDKTTFFLSSDNDKYIELLKQHFNNIITYNPDKSLTNQQNAFIDLLLLSKNKLILGNSISTFTEMAWWYSNCNSKVIFIN